MPQKETLSNLDGYSRFVKPIALEPLQRARIQHEACVGDPTDPLADDPLSLGVY
jgi:hypothetical protein